MAEMLVWNSEKYFTIEQIYETGPCVLSYKRGTENLQKSLVLWSKAWKDTMWLINIQYSCHTWPKSCSLKKPIAENNAFSLPLRVTIWPMQGCEVDRALGKMVIRRTVSAPTPIWHGEIHLKLNFAMLWITLLYITWLTYIICVQSR